MPIKIIKYVFDAGVNVAVIFKGQINMKDVILFRGVNLLITEEEVQKLNRAHNRAEIGQMKVIDDFTWNVGEYTYRRVDNNDGTLTVYKTDNRNNNKCWAIITE